METTNITNELNELLNNISYLTVEIMQNFLQSNHIHFETKTYISNQDGLPHIVVYVDRKECTPIRNEIVKKCLKKELKTNFSLCFFDSEKAIEHLTITGEFLDE